VSEETTMPPKSGDWVQSDWEPMIVLWDAGWYSYVVLPRT